MQLCEVPTSQIHQVEIPTGLPLVFDPRTKRIRLLEDDSDETSLFTKYNFGGSPDLLFKPDFVSSEEFQQILAAESTSPLSPYGQGGEDDSRDSARYDPILRLRSQGSAFPPSYSRLSTQPVARK